MDELVMKLMGQPVDEANDAEFAYYTGRDYTTAVDREEWKPRRWRMALDFADTVWPGVCVYIMCRVRPTGCHNGWYSEAHN